MQTRALEESLKLLFNLTRYYPDRVSEFDPLLSQILLMLNKITLPTPTLQAPITLLVNTLLNLNLSIGQEAEAQTTEIFPEGAPTQVVDRLISILGSGLESEKDVEKLEISATPLVSALRRINELAQPEATQAMKDQLLPTSEDRTQPLGRTDSLPSQLLRLSNAPSATNLKEAISGLLFELSDKDALTFIRNVGYGYAAGFLLSHRIAIPPAAAQDGNLAAVEVDGQEVNPITGQRRDMESVDTGPPMTEEEREREAERLFVLFERLRATGVVNVANPVQQAQQDGRLEEVD